MRIIKMKEKIKVKLPDGKIIERVPTIIPFCNFQIFTIRYNNADYMIGDGDEYLRGMPEVFELGKKLNTHERKYRDHVLGYEKWKEIKRRERLYKPILSK
jgi:hypothetical protein